jgi:hypothetical protein
MSMLPQKIYDTVVLGAEIVKEILVENFNFVDKSDIRS